MHKHFIHFDKCHLSRTLTNGMCLYQVIQNKQDTKIRLMLKMQVQRFSLLRTSKSLTMFIVFNTGGIDNKIVMNIQMELKAAAFHKS
jgi:hypothetical protein